MAERMATWVVWAVINSHRQMEYYLATQKQKKWPKVQLPDNAQVSVLVLGCGTMGGAAALAVKNLGAHDRQPTLLWKFHTRCVHNTRM